MITIPTGDLVGIVNDAIPFASADKEDNVLRSVHLEWDGEVMHAIATDRIKLGWSQWSPDDDHEIEHQETLFTKWGGVDEPWAVTIAYDDAKHLAKTFALPAKQMYIPLTIERVGRSVRVSRTKADGHSGVVVVIEDTFVEYPSVRQVLADNDVTRQAGGLSVSVSHLAAFAKVRPRGPMAMRFTGPHSLIHVTIGERFIGAVHPLREGRTPAAEPAAAAETQDAIAGGE